MATKQHICLGTIIMLIIVNIYTMWYHVTSCNNAVVLKNKTHQDGLSISISTRSSETTHPVIFLLGDSVERYVISDTCESINTPFEDWSYPKFQYKKGSSASALCITQNGSIAHLHLYGSQPTGPYLHGTTNTVDDPWTDSPLRICTGIELFVSKVGTPHIIGYQSMLWDIMVFYENNTLDHDDAVRIYTHNILARIEDVKRCKPSSSKIVLRTIPWHPFGGVLVQKFNNVIRMISQEHKIVLVDFDEHLWGWREHNEQNAGLILRDIMHPSVQYSILLGKQYLKLANM
jgi:hypothetical protein